MFYYEIKSILVGKTPLVEIIVGDDKRHYTMSVDAAVEFGHNLMVLGARASVGLDRHISLRGNDAVEPQNKSNPRQRTQRPM